MVIETVNFIDLDIETYLLKFNAFQSDDDNEEVEYKPLPGGPSGGGEAENKGPKKEQVG